MSATTIPCRLAYSPAEGAEQLGISRAKFYELITEGTIPSVKIGRSRRIRAEALVDYLDSLERGAA